MNALIVGSIPTVPIMIYENVILKWCDSIKILEKGFLEIRKFDSSHSHKAE